ncbi:MAG: hypothetical protein RMK19_07200 [Bacteroidia bacterium]|nr:hypothetical protein [Bacteroidia bacterium]MDW8015783.1 hypothetical protein [Bacteroidia bacterium]
MDWEKVIEAWDRFRSALSDYEEALRSEMGDALRAHEMQRLIQLQQMEKRLRRLQTALHKVEKLLSL